MVMNRELGHVRCASRESWPNKYNALSVDFLGASSLPMDCTRKQKMTTSILLRVLAMSTFKLKLNRFHFLGVWWSTIVGAGLRCDARQSDLACFLSSEIVRTRVACLGWRS